MLLQKYITYKKDSNIVVMPLTLGFKRTILNPYLVIVEAPNPNCVT